MGVWGYGSIGVWPHSDTPIHHYPDTPLRREASADRLIREIRVNQVLKKSEGERHALCSSRYAKSCNDLNEFSGIS